jgi:hypothetical protein
MNNALKKILRYALSTVGVLLLLWYIFGILSMSGSHANYQQARAYLDGAQNVLIAHGLCKDEQDCGKKEILFGQGGGVIKLGPFEYGGINISIYGVSSPEVVGDLVKAFGEIYKKQKGPRLTVHMYETKHQDSETQFAFVRIE